MGEFVVVQHGVYCLVKIVLNRLFEFSDEIENT